MSANYYKGQLDKITPCVKNQYAPVVKIQSENGNTKWMDLNDESANVLHKWLEENYNIKK